MLASAALAMPAQASISVSSWSLTPSTTQAGGNATTAGPNLTLDAQFSSTTGDTPKDAQINLAAGLLANPSVVPLCSTTAFNAGSCPAQSQIGSGYITGTAPQFGFQLSLPTSAYLIQPTGSEIARIGLIVDFFDYPVATQSGPILIRTTPDVGINIPLAGLPNQLDGVQVIIDGLHLVINGAVNGKSFTRNPTSCSSATSTITVDSYGAPTTQVTKSSSFTPTGCSSLAYAPAITGSVTVDSADDGMAMFTAITQKYGEADDQAVNIAFPLSASPRLSALGAACTNTNLSTCPSIGTAKVVTPLLKTALTAKIVLVSHPQALPTLAILIPAPIGLTLSATPVLTGSSVQALVTNIPDIPLTSLTLSLPGGPNSLFRQGTHICNSPQSFGGSFTSWSGKTASPSSAATVTGCPTGTTTGSTTTTTKAPSRAGSAGGTQRIARTTAAPARRGAGAVTITGLRSAFAKMTLVLGAGHGSIRSVTLRLPAGLSAGFGHVGVVLDGKRVRATVIGSGRVLTVRFARAGKVAIVTLGHVTVVRAGHARRYVVIATLRRTAGRSSTLRMRAQIQ